MKTETPQQIVNELKTKFLHYLRPIQYGGCTTEHEAAVNADDECPYVALPATETGIAAMEKINES